MSKGNVAEREVIRLIERFVCEEPNTGCWLWFGCTNDKGYARIYKPKYGESRAHRLFFKVLKSPIPKGLVIDHLCRTRACVNPDHLEAVTSRVNTLRGNTLAAQQAARETCPNGHPYDVVERTTGKRRCRQCRNDQAKRCRNGKRKQRRT